MTSFPKGVITHYPLSEKKYGQFCSQRVRIPRGLGCALAGVSYEGLKGNHGGEWDLVSRTSTLPVPCPDRSYFVG